MNVKNLKKNKKGFTLVEIIVVLVIVGILMALAVPAVMKYINEAAETKVQSQVRAGYVAAQSYATSQNGENPGISNDDLKQKVNNVDAINGELGLSKTGEGAAAKYPEGAVESIVCELTDKKIDSCTIKVVGSSDEYTATQTDIKKKQ